MLLGPSVSRSTRHTVVELCNVFFVGRLVIVSSDMWSDGHSHLDWQLSLTTLQDCHHQFVLTKMFWLCPISTKKLFQFVRSALRTCLPSISNKVLFSHFKRIPSAFVSKSACTSPQTTLCPSRGFTTGSTSWTNKQFRSHGLSELRTPVS